MQCWRTLRNQRTAVLPIAAGAALLPPLLPEPPVPAALLPSAALSEPARTLAQLFHDCRGARESRAVVQEATATSIQAGLAPIDTRSAMQGCAEDVQ